VKVQVIHYPASAVRASILCSLLSLAALAQGPAHLLRAGATLAPAGWKTYGFSTSPVLDFNYGFRPWRYLQLGAGAVLDRQAYPDCCKYGCTDSRRNLLTLGFTWCLNCR
jgi:hypothetical protein